MVRIELITHPANVRVSSKTESMAKVLEASVQQREDSKEPSPSRVIEESKCKSRSGDSEDSETASDDSRCLRLQRLLLSSRRTTLVTFLRDTAGPLERNRCWSLM
jgi:hypothetical protein